MESELSPHLRRALDNGTNSAQNTATGDAALQSNSSGCCNTATGFQALESNTTGDSNTATGESALLVNHDGVSNVATGFAALLFNSSGSYNVATGNGALYHNNASYNAANGYLALFGNTTGSNNTAEGSYSLYSNTSGHYNVAAGVSSLGGNTTGQKNVAVGLKALFSNTTGSSNIAVGYAAGINVTTSNNIDIGSGGSGADSKVIRIGSQGTQTGTFIAGISGVAVAGADVVVNAQGKLGVVASSARYKKDVKDMGTSTQSLMSLRPVTFKYKSDSEGLTQYGLVAEEVERVYPELVTHDANGKVETVRYTMLISMLLNELQKQAGKNQKQAEQIEKLSQELVSVKASAIEQAAQLSALQ